MSSTLEHSPSRASSAAWSSSSIVESSALNFSTRHSRSSRTPLACSVASTGGAASTTLLLGALRTGVETPRVARCGGVNACDEHSKSKVMILMRAAGGSKGAWRILNPETVRA